jgi:hypothetical protein
MAKMHVLLVGIIFTTVLFAARESQAVIYKYVDDQGIPSFTDDLQKIPEQYRAGAVIVTGGADYDAYAEQEKARLAAEARVLQEQSSQTSSAVNVEEKLSARLIRSGVAVVLFAALLFVAANLHVLQVQAQVLLRVRIALALLLVAFLGYTHAGDVAGLFGNAWDTAVNPISRAQERSAKRGRKAAADYKAMNKVLEQGEQGEDAKIKEIERKIDEAEQGK